MSDYKKNETGVPTTDAKDRTSAKQNAPSSSGFSPDRSQGEYGSKKASDSTSDMKVHAESKVTAPDAQKKS